MEYKCINNLEKFCFQEATMLKCDYNPGLMTWDMAGVIARHNNPENDTLVDRFISDARIRFYHPVITKFILEGQKYYNANNVLMEEIPDKPVPTEKQMELFKQMKGGEMFVVNTKEPSQNPGALCCEVAIDLGEDTYWFEVEYEKVILEWDFFMNKAMLEG